jgi:hypothetical protein
VNVRYVSDCGKTGFCPVNGVIDGKDMSSGKLANPVDIERLTTLRFDRGPRPRAVVTPQRSWGKIAMRLLLELPHFDINDFIRLARRMDGRWNGQGIDIARQFDRASKRSR